MPKPRIDLYLDIISPWSKIALVTLKRYKPYWDFELNIIPRYLGGVMVASGNKPPITVKNKGIYLTNFDQPLVAEYYGTELIRPSKFPLQTMSMIRFLRVLYIHEPSVLEEVVSIFTESIWGRNNAKAEENIKPENFRALIAESVIPNDKFKKYMELSVSEDNKAAVKREAEELVHKGGAFGFPWIVVTREDGTSRPFFGSDRMELIAFYLGKKWNGPYPDGRTANTKSKL